MCFAVPRQNAKTVLPHDINVDEGYAGKTKKCFPEALENVLRRLLSGGELCRLVIERDVDRSGSLDM